MLALRGLLYGLLFASFAGVVSLFFESSLELVHLLSVASVVGTLFCGYAIHSIAK